MATRQPYAGVPVFGTRCDASYTWCVVARQDAQEVRSPPAPFYVLAQGTATALMQMHAQYPHAYLLLGVLYLQAGLLDDAARELERLRTASPYAPASQKLWYDRQYLRKAQDAAEARQRSERSGGH